VGNDDGLLGRIVANNHAPCQELVSSFMA